MASRNIVLSNPCHALEYRTGAALYLTSGLRDSIFLDRTGWFRHPRRHRQPRRVAIAQQVADAAKVPAVDQHQVRGDEQRSHHERVEHHAERQREAELRHADERPLQDQKEERSRDDAFNGVVVPVRVEQRPSSDTAIEDMKHHSTRRHSRCAWHNAVDVNDRTRDCQNKWPCPEWQEVKAEVFLYPAK